MVLAGGRADAGGDRVAAGVEDPVQPGRGGPHRGAGLALAAFALLLLLRFALTWLGIWLGLLIKTPEAVTSAQILVWPLGFVSSAFVAPATMPGWLATIAYWNPLSATITAARYLFGNPAAQGGAWPAHHPVILAVALPLAMSAVLLPLSARHYRTAKPFRS